MSQNDHGRTRRGLSNMRHPGKLIRQERVAYEPRFGEAFTNRMVRGAWTVVVGAWLMVIGLLGMVPIGALVLFTTGSLPDVYTAVYGGFGVIVGGGVVNAAGSAIRSRVIQTMSVRIIAADPSVNSGGAAKLIHFPQMYDRWLAKHSGFTAR